MTRGDDDIKTIPFPSLPPFYLLILSVKLDEGFVNVQSPVEIAKGDVFQSAVMPAPSNDLVACIHASVLVELERLVADVKIDSLHGLQQLQIQYSREVGAGITMVTLTI